MDKDHLYGQKLLNKKWVSSPSDDFAADILFPLNYSQDHIVFFVFLIIDLSLYPHVLCVSNTHYCDREGGLTNNKGACPPNTHTPLLFLCVEVFKCVAASHVLLSAAEDADAGNTLSMYLLCVCELSSSRLLLLCSDHFLADKKLLQEAP